MAKNDCTNNDCNCGNESVNECGCGHDHSEKVIITLDGGTDIECNIIGTFDVNEKDYIALLPEGDEEVLIFNFFEKDGETELRNIESDEEYEAVSTVFYDLFLNDPDLEDEDFDDEDLDDEDFDDDDEEEDFEDEDLDDDDVQTPAPNKN